MNVVTADHLKLCWDILLHCHQLHSMLFKILVHLCLNSFWPLLHRHLPFANYYIFNGYLSFSLQVCSSFQFFFFFAFLLTIFFHLSRSQILQLALIDFFYPFNSFSSWTLLSPSLKSLIFGCFSLSIAMIQAQLGTFIRRDYCSSFLASLWLWSLCIHFVWFTTAWLILFLKHTFIFFFLIPLL